MRTFLQGAVSVVLVMTLASCGYHLAGRGENSGRLFPAELNENEQVSRFIANKAIRKTIIVPDRLVNFVLDP